MEEDAPPSAPDVTLAPFDGAAHTALLARWLEAPHVRLWWGPEVATEALALNDAQRLLIFAEGEPVGFLAWHTLTRRELDEAGLADIPEGGLDIDLLIGEVSFPGRGIGTRALELFAASHPKAPFFSLCPSPDNKAALRAYAKAGFALHRVFDDPDMGPHLFLVRPGRVEKLDSDSDSMRGCRR